MPVTLGGHASGEWVLRPGTLGGQASGAWVFGTGTLGGRASVVWVFGAGTPVPEGTGSLVFLVGGREAGVQDVDEAAGLGGGEGIGLCMAPAAAFFA